VLCRELIGRDEVLESARTALSDAGRGSGGVLFVSGEAGVGKSRLVTDLVTTAREAGVQVLFGRAVRAETPVRGIATSGWRGRSFSLGIADSVTVLARTAAMADAAATIIANAVDVPDARYIARIAEKNPLEAGMEPFSAEKMKALYGSQAAYLAKVDRRIQEMVREGWIAAGDAPLMRKRGVSEALYIGYEGG